MGRVANINNAHTPARPLPFGSVGWETPMGTYSVSSISHSTKSPSWRSAVATDPPAAKRAKRTPATKGKGTFCSVDDNDDDGGDKYDDEDDIIPATNGPILTTAQDATVELFISEKAVKRAFSVRALATDVPLTITTASAMIKMCRSHKDLDYIVHVLKNWQVGVNIKTMDPCPERDRI
jgi:hypothetical protein